MLPVNSSEAKVVVMFSGSVGEDIEKLVHTFKYGKKYEAIKLEQDIGQITIAIGKVIGYLLFDTYNISNYM